MKHVATSLLFMVHFHAFSQGVPDEKDTMRFDIATTKHVPSGYDVRLEPPQASGKYRLILRYPDGKEDVVWEPPGTRCDSPEAVATDTPVPVTFDREYKARISGHQLGVVMSIGYEDWWWVRWDMEQKRRLPLIQFPMTASQTHFYLPDGESIQVRTSDHRVSTLTPDADGNLYKDGQLWKKRDYAIYGSDWKVVHCGPYSGNKITRINSPRFWPFTAKWTPISGDNSPGSDGSRRVWPPNRGAGSEDSPPPAAQAMTAPVANVPGPSGSGGGRAMWVLGAALSALTGIAGWIVTSRQRRMNKDFKAGK